MLPYRTSPNWWLILLFEHTQRLRKHPSLPTTENPKGRCPKANFLAHAKLGISGFSFSGECPQTSKALCESRHLLYCAELRASREPQEGELGPGTRPDRASRSVLNWTVAVSSGSPRRIVSCWLVPVCQHPKGQPEKELENSNFTADSK